MSRGVAGFRSSVAKLTSRGINLALDLRAGTMSCRVAGFVRVVWVERRFLLQKGAAFLAYNLGGADVPRASWMTRPDYADYLVVPGRPFESRCPTETRMSSIEVATQLALFLTTKSSWLFARVCSALSNWG